MAGAEIGEAAAVAAPFVAVAHQDRRQVLAPGDLVEDRAPLLPAAQPRNDEVHAAASHPRAPDSHRPRAPAARFSRRPGAPTASLPPAAPSDTTRLAALGKAA